MADGVGLPALHSALHRSLHDAVDLVPAHSQLLAHGLLAGSFQPSNGEGFKQSRKAAGGIGPREFHYAHAVCGALAARWVSMQDGAVLASVEVAPLPLGLVVVEFAGRPTLRARPGGQVVMGQIDVHFLGEQVQVHGGHAPGVLDAQNAAVKLTVFHSDGMAIHAVWVQSARSTRGDAQGGFQRSGLKPLVWGEPPVFGGVGGTFPPRLSPGGGNGKGGDSNSLPQANGLGATPENLPARAYPCKSLQPLKSRNSPPFYRREKPAENCRWRLRELPTWRAFWRPEEICPLCVTGRSMLHARFGPVHRTNQTGSSLLDPVIQFMRLGFR